MSKQEYRYLIVEDDPAFVEILKVVMAKVPEMKLIGVSDNTLDAAKRIDMDKPDILLLDINISGLEGPEVLEISDHKPLAIVISSHPEDVMENYEVDYVSFIQKPLKNAEQLINAIHKCIKLKEH
ncbi:LytR/AlgR family response regulator transcription factor [Ekhidna sp.]|uniref:LytR/AlgR family response regulator transcription factor n=1 Tax=Ekhidna sp. TaxID=2608089 RepID=UPI003B511AA9